MGSGRRLLLSFKKKGAVARVRFHQPAAEIPVRFRRRGCGPLLKPRLDCVVSHSHHSALALGLNHHLRISQIISRDNDAE